MTEKQESNLSIAMAILPALPARYEILEAIGSGAYGTVFKAMDRQLDRVVAIKILHLLAGPTSEEQTQQRFLKEAKVLVSLDHPNIVKLLSSGLAEDGSRYHVMEYIEGTPLSLEIGSGKRLSPERFLKVFLQLLSALDYAHSKGVVHRDLKPSNILISENPIEGVQAKIVDFGIARLDEKNDEQKGQSLTKTGSIVGSPKYMSPEQCKGLKAEQSSDIYSIACVMYEALTGNAPFEADSNIDLMYKHCSEPMPSLSKTSRIRLLSRLEQLLERCLAKEPSSRPPSAGEFANELEEIFFDTKNNTDIFRALAKQEAEERRFSILSWASLAMIGAVLLASWCFFKFMHVQESTKDRLKITNETKAAKLEAFLKENVERRKTRYRQAKIGGNPEEVFKQAEKLETEIQKLGIYYKEDSNWKKAEEVFQEGLDLAPIADSPPKSSNQPASNLTQVIRLADLAYCKFMLGKLKSADLLLQKALNLPLKDFKTNAELQATIVLLRLHQLDFDSAGTAFEKMSAFQKEYSKSIEANSDYVKGVVGIKKITSETARFAKKIMTHFEQLKLENQRQKLAAVRFLNKIGKVCVDEETETQRPIFQAAHTLLNEIAKRTDGYKEAAIQTYRLSIQRCKQAGDLSGAENFAREIKHLENSE